LQGLMFPELCCWGFRCPEIWSCVVGWGVFWYFEEK